MNSEVRYQVSHANIVHEMIDGEVVIVHLDRGHYYSLSNSAAVIWEGLAQGLSQAEIIENLKQSFTGDLSDMENGIQQLVVQLIEEGLVIRREMDNSVIPHKPKDNHEKSAFAQPILEKFTDLEDLLLLDPIHEVDETGWPRAKPE